MSGFCRGCLTKYDEFIELLQYTEKNRRLFLYSTSIQVKQNDNIKFQLCKDCYFSMKLACKFKKQCRNSDKLIKNYLALKEAGDNVDLNTYLKNKDVSLTFRLPMVLGNSTPANQKVKEDDNESTCTSIRNFITDIMHDEEILVTEARIIHEVMREEPDVLDDSLDSHWLQDDASIDSDFRLDFSISPFSTPHSTKYDPYHLETKLTPNKYLYCAQNVTTKSIENNVPHIKEETIDITESLVTGTENLLYSVPEETEYMNIDEKKSIEEELLNSATNLVEKNIKNEKITCRIDRNLENALKNVNNDVFALSDVLASSSPDFVGVSPASTPRIIDIIYGDNRSIVSEIDTYDSNKASIKEKENDNDEVDILKDFFKEQKDTKFLEENGVIEAYSKEYGIQMVGEEQLSIKKLYCKMCEKKFKSVQGLKMHFAKYHKLKIIENAISKNKRYFKKLRICHFCGKEYTDVRSFFKHLNTHMILKSRKHICTHCQLKFTSKSKLKVHMRTHGNTTKLPDQEETQNPKKIFLCTYCGAEFKSMGNYTVHVRRHTKDYVMRCEICDKGFYRKFDVDIHMRQHTNERPFKCDHCPATFKRQDVLVMHAKSHFGEKNFICANCGTKFAVKYRLTEHLKRRICHKKRKHAIENIIESLDKSQQLPLANTDLEMTEELLNTITGLESDKSKMSPAEIIDPEWQKLINICQKKGAEANKLKKSKEVKKQKRNISPIKKAPKKNRKNTKLEVAKSNKRSKINIKIES